MRPRDAAPRPASAPPPMQRPLLALLAASSLLAAGLVRPPRRVEAGTALRLDLPALVARADLVLEARVVSERALALPDGRIETELVLSVARTFVGASEPVRTIRVPGGVLADGRGMVLPGVPRLAPGADYLLCLGARGSSGARLPVGLAQGVFRVARAAGGGRVLVRDQAHLALVERASDAPVAAPAGEAFGYAETIAVIEAAARARRARGAR